MLLILGFLFWIFWGLVAWGIATKKGRAGCVWIVLGLLFGPLAMLAAAMMMPDYRALDERAQADADRAGAKEARRMENRQPVPARLDSILKIAAIVILAVIVVAVAVAR